MLRLLRLALLALPLGAAAPVREPVLEQSVLAEINRARADPRGYAARLRDYRRYFHGRIVRYPGNPDGLATAEGVRAVDDAIAFLEKQRRLPPLAASPLFQAAARDHVAEQGPRGATGHRSSNGDRADVRLRRHGGGGGFVGEVITYGPPSAAEVVRQLIVDDGVRDRGHRHALYRPEFHFAGAGCGPHARYRKMCVVVLGRNADGR